MRVSSHNSEPMNPGELHDAASTSAVASCTALNTRAKSSGSTRRWTWNEVFAPSSSRLSRSIRTGSGSVPLISILNGSRRRRRMLRSSAR
jgi:hypothetical protein